jgi:hypothetical protein
MHLLLSYPISFICASYLSSFLLSSSLSSMLNYCYLAKHRPKHAVTAEKQQNISISSDAYLLSCFSVLREVRESKQFYTKWLL